MARINYSYDKRQRELAKQRKKEEKRLRKLNAPDAPNSASLDANAPLPPGDEAAGTPPPVR